MNQVFDISQEELPIFLSEVDEHIQALDEGLVILEGEVQDVELIQKLFRAAHTIKGAAGMIGHKRMVEVTHAMETALDGIRKNTLAISTPLVNLCLEGVDALRSLRDEVAGVVADPVNVSDLVTRFQAFIHSASNGGSPIEKKPEAVVAETAPVVDNEPRVSVEADISPDTIASAARAFQIMLALQGLGEIVSMTPTSEEIESAAPVAHFSAVVKTGHSEAQVREALDSISEIDRLDVKASGKIVVTPKSEISKAPEALPVKPEPAPEPKSEAVSPTANISTPDAYLKLPPDEDFPRLGEFLVSRNIISQAQLDEALRLQNLITGKKPRLGQVLLEQRMISYDSLDQALAEYIVKQSATISALKGVPEPGKEKAAGQVVRITVERLDAMMNLVGELITDRNRLNNIRSSIEAKSQHDELSNSLTEAITHLGRLTDQLQEEVLLIRMVPFTNVFSKFPRLVRDLSQKAGKQIQLVIEGQETEVDRSVIDEINDPLIHLLRNAVDHGVETPEARKAAGKPEVGTIRLAARHEQGKVIVTVQDDGKGIDTEKLKASAIQKGLITEADAHALTEEKAIDLIFLSGLSTAAKLTDISGRGVGMDIVRSNIEKINGSITIQTKVGVGTTFEIILPLTLAIVPTLLVRAEKTSFALPLVVVTETLRIKMTDIQTVNKKPVIILRDKVLPLIWLTDALRVKTDHNTHKRVYVVVVQSNKDQIGLIVDDLIGEEEIVVKSLGSMFTNIIGISGAAILGDGSVALIIDIAGLFKTAGIH